MNKFQVQLRIKPIRLAHVYLDLESMLATLRRFLFCNFTGASSHCFASDVEFFPLAPT